jgi:hypothetical protein
MPFEQHAGRRLAKDAAGRRIEAARRRRDRGPSRRGVRATTRLQQEWENGANGERHETCAEIVRGCAMLVAVPIEQADGR